MAFAIATAFVDVRARTTSLKGDVDRELGSSMGPLGAKHGKTWGKSFSGAAKGILASGTGMLAALGVGEFVKKSVEAAEESRKVTAQTAAVIKSTGGAANVTAKQIDNLAGSLMRKTGIDDESIKAGQNMLLTFRNIRNESGKNNDIFNRSSKVLLDMTAALHGGDVSGESMRKQAIQLGKALNDPVKGMSALQRVGVSFTDQQKKQIKSMVASGDQLGAQKIILRELSKEFGGSAAAMATPAEKMKTAFHEIQEGVGNALMPVIELLAKFLLSTVLPALSALLPTLMGLARKAIPIVTAAIGYLVVGFTAIVKFATGLPGPLKIAGIAIIGLGVAMKLAASANPWFLLATAIVLVVGIIVKNWKSISAFTARVWHDILGFVKGVWDWIKKNWPLLLTILAGPFGLAVAFIIKHWGTIKTGAQGVIKFIGDAWHDLTQALRNAFAWFVGKLLGFFGSILKGAATAFGWIPGLGGKLKTAASKFDTFRKNVNDSIRGISGKNVNVGVSFSGKQLSGAYFTGKASEHLKAAGGPIRGPGGPTEDRAGLFALSNNEYVVRAASHAKYGSAAMDAVNRGQAVIG